MNVFCRALCAGLLLPPGAAFAQTTGTVIAAKGNPVITSSYTADPSALVYNGKAYLYTGHDEVPSGKETYIMRDWLCYSTEDMINWTEYASPLNTKDFASAKGDAWASTTEGVKPAGK